MLLPDEFYSLKTNPSILLWALSYLTGVADRNETQELRMEDLYKLLGLPLYDNRIELRSKEYKYASNETVEITGKITAALAEINKRRCGITIDHPGKWRGTREFMESTVYIIAPDL